MDRKATREQIKNQNTNLVLRTIFQTGSISRADIARATELTRPTVSSIVSDLLDMRLVTEVGFGPSVGGKPPMMVEIDTNAWRILCVDIGNQEFRGALINLRGKIMERRTLAAQDQTGEDALRLVYQLIDELRAAAPVPLLGIGIGSPGLIDAQAGIVRQAVNLAWQDLPLRQLLEQRYDVPIYLANDSQTAALAEYTFAGERTSRHLLLIKIGRGIGAGIILNGELFHGDGAGAGEIGHVALDSVQPPETLETRASTRSLLRRAKQVTGDDLTWEELVRRTAAGDSALRQIVSDASHALGVTLAHLIAALNVHNIVISGRVDQFGDFFKQSAYETCQRRVLPKLMENTTITYSSLGTDIVLLGCAALILKYELEII